LVVNFDASASTDPDAGDSVVSYTFDFGDGSPPVTQAGATISHTYQSNGHFHATVTVADSHGLVSSNAAGVEIEVELPLDRVVSRKAHGGVAGSPFDVILFDPTVYPDGNGEIECRDDGTGHTVIYSFGSEFTVTGAASSTPTINNGGTVATHGPGPGTNQYQIHFNANVTNAQRHTITLNGVPVHNDNIAGSAGNATLNNAISRLDALLGDVNGDGFVLSGDYTTTRQKSGTPVSSTSFRYDVNADGFILSGDYTTVRQRSGTQLP
jgi:hypothetical protein